MRILTLARTEYTAYGIMGKLTEQEDVGKLNLVTLEHAYPCTTQYLVGKGQGLEATAPWVKNYEPKLPVGSYTCVRSIHQLSHGDPFTTFEVMGVPGHTGILFHVGNYNSDSEGCILLGRSTVFGAIRDSKVAFALFIAALAGVDSFTLEVVG